MDDEKKADSTNPYMALRAAKIARNEARLKELGLYKPKLSRGGTSSGRSTASVASRKRKLDAKPSAIVPTRRSLRISGLSSNPNYVESKDFKERDHSRIRQFDKSNESENKGSASSMKPTLPRPPPKPSPAALNSVRTISLNASILVQKYLAKPMETFGKYFVIETSFDEAAYEDDKQRLQGITRLSFNKFSGVQPWKNVIFLWINVGGPADANSLVNEFTLSSDGSCRVTWFGGSKMREDSPVIQTLIEMGKEAASKPTTTTSGIILWCRQYNWETRKLLPYTCLGRLAYQAHDPGSYPVAFTWKLIDYEKMMETKEMRSVFHEISGLEEQTG